MRSITPIRIILKLRKNFKIPELRVLLSDNKYLGSQSIKSDLRCAVGKSNEKTVSIHQEEN